MVRNNTWSDDELFETLKTYMEMLSLEQSGRSYSKTEFRRNLIAGPLSDRSEGSIEFRMQNISSFRAEQGMDWIQGYKPMDHLGENVRSRLESLFQRYNGGIVRNTSGGDQVTETSESEASRGPSPRSSGYTVEPTDPTTSTAKTYIARYGLTNVFKFGWTSNLDERLSQLNQHIPDEQEIPGHARWNFYFISSQVSSNEAHETEQAIREKLRPYHTIGERFICSQNVVKSIAETFRLSAFI